MNQEFKDWNNELNQIGKIILEKERECLERLGRGLTPDNCDERYPDQYFKKVGYNLWAGYEKNGVQVQYPHFEEYGGGSGGELKDKRTPAKMKSIRSSSAMTYNLLGNKRIELINGTERFSEGTYDIEYEKQLYTIRENSQPANLDAYLYKKDSQEAIFCEMKMLEWIFNKPGALKEAYTNAKVYYSNTAEDTKTTDAFLKAIKILKAEMPTYEEAICYKPLEKDGVLVLNRKGKQRNEAVKGFVQHFYRYDAWQMFKHTLGIYNMTSEITREEISVLIAGTRTKKGRSIVELPKLHKVTLLNVVFEPSENLFTGELKEIYKRVKELERENFIQFRNAMVESGVVEAFDRDCHIDFDMQYMSAAQFMDCFDLGERKDFLERYRLGV